MVLDFEALEAAGRHGGGGLLGLPNIDAEAAVRPNLDSRIYRHAADASRSWGQQFERFCWEHATATVMILLRKKV